MIKSNKENILVIGKKNKKLGELISILSEYSNCVFVASCFTDMMPFARKNHINLITITDSLGKNPSKDFILKIRHFFPHAKVICLFDRVAQDTEVFLRSIGIIYLGSYNNFKELAYKILPAAMDSYTESREGSHRRTLRPNNQPSDH